MYTVTMYGIAIFSINTGIQQILEGGGVNIRTKVIFKIDSDYYYYFNDRK